MSGVMQEKFQIQVPNQPDGDHEWVSDKRARVKKGTPGREGRAGGDQASKAMNNAVHYGTLPPGTDIEDAEIADIRQQRVTFSGEDDVSRDNNPEARKQGFTRRQLRPTDDEYTREHNDAFYDEITVDGVTGFLERNNVLDRH